VFNLITGSAYAINGDSAIAIPSIGVTVPGFTSSTLSLNVIQRAQTRFGRVGLQIPTSQASLAVSQTIDATNGLNLGSLLRATGTITLRQEVASAVGTLAQIACGSTPGIRLTVSPQPITTIVDVDLTISLGTILGNVPVARVQTGLGANPVGSTAPQFFNYENEFLPDVGTGSMRESATNPLGLAGLLDIQSTNVTLLGAIPVPIGTLLTSLNTIVLDPVLSTLDPAITGPVSTALGLSVGSADLGANDMTCSNVQLVN
jgi:hypothetical protein